MHSPCKLQSPLSPFYLSLYPVPLFHAILVHGIVDKRINYMTIPLRLSVSEAAKFFGVDAKTIRRALKDNKLSYVVVRGRYRITLDSLLKWSQQQVTVRNKRDAQGIGQYVDKWKISQPLYSPNPKRLEEDEV